MTLNVSRQLLVLVAVGVVVAGVAFGRRSGTPAGTGAAASNSRRASARAPEKSTPVADLKLELLKTAPGRVEPSTRNPFQFKPKAAPPPPPPSANVAHNAPVIVAPPPIPEGPPPLPPIGLKYIGVLDTAQGRLAVFRDSGGDIVNGKEGDIIDGRYRLLKIGVESADLAYVDGRGRQTIRLSGQ